MKFNRDSFSGNTILRRLLVCFVVSTFFPTVMITVLLCMRFEHNYRSAAEAQTVISENLIKAYVESYCDEIDTISSAPYYHSYFSSRKKIDPADPDYLTKLSDFQAEMQGLINLTTLSHSDIRDLVIYSDGQLLFFPLFYNEYRYFRNNMVLEEQPWYDHALERNGKTAFTPSRTASNDPEALLDVSNYYVTRKIRNLRQPDQVNLMILNLQSTNFESRLKNIGLLYDSFAVITNEKQELIYSGRPLTGEAFEKILSGKQFRYDGSLWNSLSSHDPDQPLDVRIVYSLDEISRHIRSLIWSAVGIYTVCIIIALVLFYSLNRWIVNSTATLQQTFRQLEDGNLQVRCPEVEVEEFNRIGASLNDVIIKLDEKIKNEYMLTIQQKSLQLSALQSHIQPHFLINTIYCFIALNQIGETRKLNDGFYSLAHLLRYVLNKEHYSTIGKECDFLEDYLKLQKLRFAERLSYEIDCPEEYRQVQIPRLILQPLVENAVIHGIEPCEHPCFCRISVRREEERLMILVEDNGIGFDAEAVREKLSREGKDAFMNTKTTVGLPYVQGCLLLWQPEAELHLSSGETTRVELQIPWGELVNEPADH